MMAAARMQRSRKLSRSGYKIPELYSELESALIARDLERACSLAAELSCTVGGHTRSVVSFLLDTYCARCVNSGRAQLNLLHSTLAHIGDGTAKSPDLNAVRDAVFRRGLCALTLLVASAHADEQRSVEAAFARVPRSEHVPSLESALQALRASALARDAHLMSSIIRAAPDEAWFSKARPPCTTLRQAQARLPDVQRLRAAARRDAVWDLWDLATELGRQVGVSEYVDNCLHAFSWNYSSSLTARARIHLLWYAFLVIVKGAPKTGPHPIDPPTLERALLSIDSVFAGTLCPPPAPAPNPAPSPGSPGPASGQAQADDDQPRLAATTKEVESRMGYLSTIPRYDPSRAWEVEKSRLAARERSEDVHARVIDLRQRDTHQRRIGAACSTTPVA